MACLALAWWQWQRFESTNGTGQNLGYALQWPLFAGFAVFAYFRFVRLERESEDTAAAEETGRQQPEPRRKSKTVAPHEIPAGLLPERPKAVRNNADPVLAEYNQYLAALHAGDIDEQVRAASSSADAAGNTAHIERSAG